jgi:hypothetical protein
LTVSQAGHVGIGTEDPGARLTVIGNGGGNVDVAVNGRIATGDASSSGGVWLNGARTMFIGQNSPTAIGMYTNGDWRFVVNNEGNVGIGTTSPGSFKLAVNGKIWAQEVNVAMTNPGPDYVFEPTYNLLPLSEVESYIKANKHLPEVPSAKQMEEEGLNLKEMNLMLLKKVEELTLHLIEQEKKANELEKKNLEMMDINKKLEDVLIRLDKLEKSKAQSKK